VVNVGIVLESFRRIRTETDQMRAEIASFRSTKTEV